MRHHQPIELLRHQSAGLHNRCMKPLQSLFSLVSRRSCVTRAWLLFPRGFSSKRETARSLRSRDQLKESALSFERVIMPRKSRENSVEEKRRMRNERSQRKLLLRTAKERENRENRKQKERCS